MNINLSEIMGTLAAAIITALLTPLRKVLYRKGKQLIIRIGKKEEAFSSQHAEREKRINELCVELRVKTDADRAYIYKFHNGEYFSPQDPLWKVTCTNETCRPGIAYTIRENRALLVSSIAEIITPLFGNECPKGTGILNKAECKCATPCEAPKLVCWYNVSEMDECSSKALVTEHGIKFMLFSPLVNKGKIIGFMGIDYCTDVTPESAMENRTELCNASNTIAYLIAAKL